MLHDSVAGFEFDDSAATVFDLALASGLFASKGDLRRTIAQGGLSVDDERVTDGERPLGPPIAGRYHVVRHGRRRLAVGILRA